MGIVLGLQLFLIDPDEFFTPSRVFSKAIVSNAIKPCRETGFTPKTADVFVSAQESLLRQIVRKRDIRSGKLAEQTSHTRLMPPRQFAEGMLVIINKNSRDEICIGQLHARRLRYWWRIVLLPLQLPHE